MSRSNHNVYLDFSDQSLSLSYESFFEHDRQILEVAASDDAMCIVAELRSPAAVSFSINGVRSGSLSLTAGTHRIALPATHTTNPGDLTVYISENGEPVFERGYRFVANYGIEYSAFMFRLYQSRAQLARTA